MSSVSAEWLKNHPTSGSVEDPNNNLKFDAHAADGKLFQSEYQLGLDGQ